MIYMSPCTNRLLVYLVPNRRFLLQSELAKASAAQSAQAAVDSMEEDSRRLAQAEASMEGMLSRVDKERADVERAVRDLKAVQAEVDKDFLVKLKSGGVVKQGALVGFVLFSVRSIVDTVSSVMGGDPSLLTAALIQGGIAVACAFVFFFL